jgi:serine/threonine protein kinase
MVALDKLHEEEEDYVEKELLQKPEQPQPLQTVDPPSYVDQALIDFHLNSKLSPELPVQDISLDDLEMGETLGTGGFGVVKSARWQGHEYALKMLRDDLEPNRFPVGAADLWKEAEFLAALKHKHVIGIHAKQMNLDDLENNFILLDKLNQSLHSKMNEWKQEDYKVRDRNEKRLKLLHGRLKVCLDIADALQYLHQHNVIFRDLKDENLGFDEEGNIKLFGKFMHIV